MLDPIPSLDFMEYIHAVEDPCGMQPVPAPPLAFTWPLALRPAGSGDTDTKIREKAAHSYS